MVPDNFWNIFNAFKMEVIEIHLQMSRIIAAIRNFPINDKKKLKLTYPGMLENLDFWKFSDFPLKMENSKITENYFLLFKSSLFT